MENLIPVSRARYNEATAETTRIQTILDSIITKLNCTAEEMMQKIDTMIENETTFSQTNTVELLQNLEMTTDSMTLAQNNLRDTKQELQTLKTDLATQTQTIADQKLEIARLAKQPGGTPAPIITTTDDVKEETSVLEFVEQNYDDTLSCLAKLKEAGY